MDEYKLDVWEGRYYCVNIVPKWLRPFFSDRSRIEEAGEYFIGTKEEAFEYFNSNAPLKNMTNMTEIFYMGTIRAYFKNKVKFVGVAKVYLSPIEILNHPGMRGLEYLKERGYFL